MLTNAIRYTYIPQEEPLREQLSNDNNRSKTLYKITKNVATNTKENILPSSCSNNEPADIFTTFFVKKINKMRS